MIWVKEETVPRAEVEAVQLGRPKDMVNRAYRRVPVYRAKMGEASVRLEHIRTLEGLQELPFVIEQDMRDNYPYGLFVVPRKKLRRIHVSSGTTRKLTVVGYMKNDLEVWKERVIRLAVAEGVSDEDVAQICSGYSMSTGALGLHNGLEKAGVAVVSSSIGNTQKQLMYIKDFKTTLLVTTPSCATRIAGVVLEVGISPRKDLKVKAPALSSEPMTEATRSELYKVRRESVDLTQNYGMSKLMGLGVSGECFKLNGMYIGEDHFIAEIIDSVIGEVFPLGEKGELVITCISKGALPLVRYRIRDIIRFVHELCPHGRTTARMEDLSGRVDDMLKIHGVNVFLSQTGEALINIEGTGSNYEIVVDRRNHSDILIIKVEVEAESTMDSYAALERLENTLRDKIHPMLGLDARTQLISPSALQWFEGKAKEVMDLRKEVR